MKISQQQLKQIIKEELSKTLNEMDTANVMDIYRDKACQPGDAGNKLCAEYAQKISEKMNVQINNPFCFKCHCEAG